MADLITIGQLSALIEDQYRLLGFIEDERERLPAFDPIFPERNPIEVRIAGEPWSVTATRTNWEFCHREAGRTVELRGDHPSPFDFQPSALLRYVLSTDEQSRLTDIVIDNWILKLIRAGRLAASRHRQGCYTFVWGNAPGVRDGGSGASQATLTLISQTGVICRERNVTGARRCRT